MLDPLWKKLRKLIKLLSHRNYRRALKTSRVAAAVEHERLLKTLDLAMVVDIGANRGQFALVSRQCFPNAAIISFEPLATAAARFQAVHRHDPLVRLFPVAIGAEPGESKMHVAAEDDSSSLLPMTSLQTSLFSESSEVATEQVHIKRLDDCLTVADISPPALLKIDVQGYELATLRGCQPLLDRFAYLYVECSYVELYQGQALADEVIAYLREQRFRLHGVYNTFYNSAGRAIQSDLLFVRQN